MKIADILATRSVGRMQSVGVMQVIPILGEDDDQFAPPTLEASTSNYGEVHVRNPGARDTILPPGSAWIVSRSAQDHAIAGGALVPAGRDEKIRNAMCVQQTQPGLIPMGEHPLHLLPARLRVEALHLRNESGYNRLWEPIARFKTQYGLSGQGNLVDFLRSFARQLDEFVAEFEIVPEQLGAIVLIDGEIAGVELTPSAAYWAEIWVPLVRICYGALALAAARDHSDAVPPTRSVLRVDEPSIEGIERALDRADQTDRDVVASVVNSVADRSLTVDRKGAQRLRGATLQTVTGSGFIGQIVTRGRDDTRFKYASLMAQGA